MSPDYVRSLLDYDPETGEFRWRVARNRHKVGSVAGCNGSHGRLIRIGGKNYGAHRLAWLITHGRWPAEHIDHINGDPADNRLSNLRECTHAENHQNVGTRKSNALGLTGVSLHRASGLYSAEIRTSGTRVLLGYFKTPAEAHAAYLDAKARFHTFQPTPRQKAMCSQVR